MTEKNLRTCPNGHNYYKSSDCPTCPVCEQERAPKDGFLSKIAAPARRALESSGIKSLKQLSEYTESEILELHGMGAKAMGILKSELKTIGLQFKI